MQSNVGAGLLAKALGQARQIFPTGLSGCPSEPISLASLLCIFSVVECYESDDQN